MRRSRIFRVGVTVFGLLFTPTFYTVVQSLFCRLPLSHDGLVQCTVLLEEKKKLVVPADHRLSDRDLIDPEELAHETLPTLPDNHQLGAWAAIHFPDHTPSGRLIARGPVVTTIRECLAVVESGEAVVIVGARAVRGLE